MVSLALLSGCAQNGACGCPAVGPRPPIVASLGALSFEHIGTRFSQTIKITSIDATPVAVTETDDCASGGNRIVTVAIPTPATTPVEVTVTPVSAGSCALEFLAPNGDGIPVPISVSAGS